LLSISTEPFDFVVDPMAGGGTTLDVCKAMSRRCRCYDIKPVRDEIQQYDITTGFPAECRGCDLVFLDPTYWRQTR
jgi:DNA modification methylase